MFNMNKKKTNGEVFTPHKIINFMLDNTYDPTKMDYILEPGCGDGRFIISLIERIIKKFGNQHDIINDKISKIYGVELDYENYLLTVLNVEKFLNDYPLITEKPKILNDDALLSDIHNRIKWSYIVGNPPYVRIHNLDSNYLKILQNKYEYLKNGMVDLYYGFFELHKNLEKNGVLCFITPSSYLYNTSGEILFFDLCEKKLLNSVIDFTSEKMFDNASTYTCITTIKKNSEIFIYKKTDKNLKTYFEKKLNFNEKNTTFLELIQDDKVNKILFKSKFKVKTGFATLSDKIFVIENFIDNGDTITFIKKGIEYTIEKGITKLCVKASKYNGINNRVIFPYANFDGVNKPITEDDFLNLYPLAYNYMSIHKTQLMLRDKGKISEEKWFLWGRTQGINNTDGSKIIISPIYLNNPFTYINQNVLVYSGYYIISESYNELFNDPNFIKSLNFISKPMALGWKSLQKKILDNLYIN